MADENQEVDPNVNADPAADAGAADAQQQADQQQQDADGQAKPHGNAGKTPWYMSRIHEETNRAREALAAREAAERRAADAEALLARMSQGGQKPEGQQQPAPQRQAAIPQDQYQRDVLQQAERLNLYQNSNDVKQAGFATFGAGFGDVLQTLTAVGATTDDFVYDVISVDKANAHVLFEKLAQDPDVAVNLVNMNPRQRIAELTRMAMKDAKPAANARGGDQQQQAKTISKAPAPKPAVEPSAPAGEADWLDPNKLDNMTEAEANAIFSRQWDAKYSGRGRAA